MKTAIWAKKSPDSLVEIVANANCLTTSQPAEKQLQNWNTQRNA
jgi:hypothetical protein